MKIAAYKQSGVPGVGVVNEDVESITPFDLSPEEASNGIQYLIEQQAEGKTVPLTKDKLPLTDIILDAPIPRPNRNVFCVGKNYFEHAHEFANSGFDSSAAQGSVPEHPIVFSKVPESVTATNTHIEYDPNVSQSIDYEVELAVIIGKTGRGITVEDALDYVWGYTIINDITARDLQGRYSQWLIGKSQDTFCPMGPFAVTRDSLALTDTRVCSRLNGELRQDSNTGLLIFDVPTIINTIAEGITLQPGDVIATGTPAGVGIGFSPPSYMKHGDVIEAEISGIGVLRNTVKNRVSVT